MEHYIFGALPQSPARACSPGPAKGPSGERCERDVRESYGLFRTRTVQKPLKGPPYWVIFRTRTGHELVIFRTRTGHFSNSNCPEQASKGRPRRTLSINPLRSSSGLYYVWKGPPPSWVFFRTRTGLFSISNWSFFKLELSRTGFQGPLSSHTFYKSLTVVERRTGHSSNSNCPEQASKGRPRRRTLSINPYGRRAGFITFGKGRHLGSFFELELVFFRTRTGLLSNSNWSFFELELIFFRSRTVQNRLSKGRPRRTLFINPLRSSSGFYYVWKGPPSWVFFRTRTMQASNVSLSNPSKP